MTINTGWSGYTKSQGKVVVASGCNFSAVAVALQTLCGLRRSWESIYRLLLLLLMMMMMMMMMIRLRLAPLYIGPKRAPLVPSGSAYLMYSRGTSSSCPKQCWYANTKGCKHEKVTICSTNLKHIWECPRMSDIRDSYYTRDTFYVLGFAGHRMIKIIPVDFRGFLDLFGPLKKTTDFVGPAMGQP